jgi:hypothetical protein
MLLPLQPEPGATRAELCELVQTLLAQKSDMLQEYVGLTFAPHTALQQPTQPPPQHPLNTQQEIQQPQQQQQVRQPGLYLTGLPVLLEGYVPDLSRLPQLMLQLARDVEWETEVECFKTLAAALAEFYALQPLLPAAGGEGATGAGVSSQGGGNAAAAAAAEGGEPLGGAAAVAAERAVQQGGQADPMDVDASSIQQQQQQEGLSADKHPAVAAAASTGGGQLNLASSGSARGLTAAPAAAASTGTGQCDPGSSGSGGGSSSGLMALAGHRSQVQREWLLRHVVMPAVKSMYRPPKSRARDGSVLLLTSMEKLYRVFERCGW